MLEDAKENLLYMCDSAIYSLNLLLVLNLIKLFHFRFVIIHIFTNIDILVY